MVLDSTNAGKWFNKDFLRERANAMRDSSGYTTEELAFYEITWPDGDATNNDPEALMIDPCPLDVNTKRPGKRINLAELPPVGGAR